MELEIVTDSNEIAKLHKKFVSLIARHNDIGKNNNFQIATPGGYLDVDYSYNKETDLWWSSDPGTKDYKYYNRFGFSPNKTSINRMVVQINYLKDFDGNREGGLWAKDKKSNYYLLHSGRMGGGVPGITKENVAQLINWDSGTVEYKKKELNFYVVCELADRNMFYQLAAFVREIERIKNILFDSDTVDITAKITKSNKAKSQSSLSTKLKKYKPEFWGKRAYKLPPRGNANCNHGLVVQTLMEELNGIGEMVKNQYVDLGIAKKDKAVAIFEVKTSNSKQHLYTAIGQLIIHSYTTKVNPQKYFVVPDSIDPNVIDDLKSLGITTITYGWKRNKPVFKNLDIVTSNVR